MRSSSVVDQIQRKVICEPGALERGKIGARKERSIYKQVLESHRYKYVQVRARHVVDHNLQDYLFLNLIVKITVYITAILRLFLFKLNTYVC